MEMDKSISNMRSAVFIAEYGPLQYHIGHFITYQLDRLLGVSMALFSIIYCKIINFRLTFNFVYFVGK